MSISSDGPKWRELPLRDAYSFGANNGVENESIAIRDDPACRGQSWKRRGFITKLFQDHGIFQSFVDRHWPHGKTSDGKTLIQRYLNTAASYGTIIDDFNGEDDNQEFEQQQFAYETDLKNYLRNNLSIIEPGLELYVEEGRDGVEYPVEGGRIDILATDGTGRLVVIELKVSRGRNRTIGQLLYYMGCINQILPDSGKCRGIIIAREIADDLWTACQLLSDVSLYEYNLSVQVKKV